MVMQLITCIYAVWVKTDYAQPIFNGKSKWSSSQLLRGVFYVYTICRSLSAPIRIQSENRRFAADRLATPQSTPCIFHMCAAFYLGLVLAEGTAHSKRDAIMQICHKSHTITAFIMLTHYMPRVRGAVERVAHLVQAAHGTRDLFRIFECVCID